MQGDSTAAVGSVYMDVERVFHRCARGAKAVDVWPALQDDGIWLLQLIAGNTYDVSGHSNGLGLS